VTVTVGAGPGNTADWVGLYLSGNIGAGQYLGWQYLNGTQTPPVTGMTSATLTFRMPNSAGSYQFVLHGGDGFNPIGTSNTVTLTGTNTLQLSNEFYGPDAYTDPAATTNYKNFMGNSFTLYQPADWPMAQFLTNHPGGFVFNMNAATLVDGTPSANIEAQRQAVASMCGSIGPNKTAWNGMVEWDQSGGRWVPNGRPRYLGQSRSQAYNTFTGYYLNSAPPLATYLGRTAAQRGCRFAAQTDYVPNTFYAYELGVDVGLLERGVDELGDIATGLAFIRGASRQYDRQWGIDLSTWRTSAGSATRFNSQGTQTGGWSPSYIRRHLYNTYLGGANILQMEPSIYYDATTGVLNPLGRTLKEFGDFALNRHPDIGRPVVQTALMLDFYSGFDTKHGLYNQANAVWYQDIPYSAGDFMVDNFLKVAYPGHWLHGTTPGASFTTAQYQQFLAAAGDPRPYEPMPTTRWGDSFDVVLSNASAAVLNDYKVVVLLGGIPIDDALRSKLQAWVQKGGTLVVNANQVTAADQSLLGVQLTSLSNTSAGSKWQPDGTAFSEPDFQYLRVTPVSATILATTTGGDPLITSNTVGLGQVILTTPAYLQARAQDQLLSIGVRLFDWLQSQYAIAHVSGPPVEYTTDHSPGRIVVGVTNNSGSMWTGTVAVDVPGPITGVKEYLSDTAVAYGNSAGAVTIPGQVPAYDIRIYAVEYTSSPSNPPVISSFSATPSSIVAGKPAVLSWSVAAAASVSIDNGVGPVAGTSVSVSPMVTTTYTLTATNAAGAITASTTLTVSPAPTSSIAH
jgi:hypothetical protein